MEHTIEKLCRQYTDLNDEEINVIQMMAKTLQPLANMEAADDGRDTVREEDENQADADREAAQEEERAASDNP